MLIGVSLAWRLRVAEGAKSIKNLKQITVRQVGS